MNPQAKAAKQNPKVGIIIPIYNVEKYLRECLDSVLNQSYENLEIVLVDDKSTDSSLLIAREYAARDSRISLIALSENSGNSVARNVGIEYLDSGKIPCGGGAVYECHRDGKALAEEAGRDSAKAEFIHFVDSDDWLERDCIEKCVELALAQDAQIVFHWRRVYNELRGEFEPQSALNEQLGLEDGKLYDGLGIFRALRVPAFSWTWLGIVRLDFLRACGVKFECGIESEDALFGMQLFALSHRVAVLDKNLICYRLRPNSISQFTLTRADRFRRQGVELFSRWQRDLAQAFGGNVYLVRHYSFCHACGVISLKMVEFMEAHRKELSPDMVECLERFISHRMIFAFHGCEFGSDPRGVRAICKKLWGYGGEAWIFSKIAYFIPRTYYALRWVKNRILG